MVAQWPTSVAPSERASWCSPCRENGTDANSTIGPDRKVGLVFWEEFSGAVTSTGFPAPSHDQHTAFVHRLPTGLITRDKVEAAMFLAQIILESGGLQYKRELACIQTVCPGVYDSSVGAPGQNYYGRGYIQLTQTTTKRHPLPCTETCDWSATPTWSPEMRTSPGRLPSGTGRSTFTSGLVSGSTTSVTPPRPSMEWSALGRGCRRHTSDSSATKRWWRPFTTAKHPMKRTATTDGVDDGGKTRDNPHTRRK